MRNGATTSISLPPTFKIKSREVIPASPADVGTLSQVIADAFHDLPPSPWLISDPVTRRRIFPAYFRLYVEHAMANGPPARRAGIGAAGSVPPEGPACAPAAAGGYFDEGQ